MRRIVYRKVNDGPITEQAPSFKRFQYTNQVLENGEWKYVNRYIGKFGAHPIVWYDSIKMAENYAPKDLDIDYMIEWDGIDTENHHTYKDIEPININDMD